jgi:hypothetical protein
MVKFHVKFHVKYLAAFALGVGLLATPTAILKAQDKTVVVTHTWSDAENPYWHQYLKERKIKDHEWVAGNKREQAAYWKWRAKHPNAPQ